jgi:hypothetical protein
MIGSKLTLAARVLIALGVTSAVMLGAFGGLAWYGSQFGPRGITAAAVACGLCWLSGIIALGAFMLFRDPQQAVHGLMLGMLFRMGIPLAAGLFLQRSHSELLKSGVIGMITGVYLLGLFVETVLAWWIAETSSGTTATEMAKAS